MMLASPEVKYIYHKYVCISICTYYSILTNFRPTVCTSVCMPATFRGKHDLFLPLTKIEVLFVEINKHLLYEYIVRWYVGQDKNECMDVWSDYRVTSFSQSYQTAQGIILQC